MAKVVKPQGVLGALVRLVSREKAETMEWLRLPDGQATRSIPAPKLPGGVAHKMSNNAYYSRDTRRAKLPIFRIETGKTELLASAEAAAEPAPKRGPFVPPGRASWP